MGHFLRFLASLAATDIDSSGCASLDGPNVPQRARVSLGSLPKLMFPDKNSKAANEMVATVNLISAKVAPRQLN
jgi:hypothetical protein